VSWSNSGLARQLDYDPVNYGESYYTSPVVADVYVEDQVAHNISRLRVRALAFAKLFFLLFLYGMVVVFLSNATATLGYDVAQIKGDIVTLNDQNKRLEVEIAQLKSLERIEQVATKDLKMVHSGRKDSLVLDSALVGSSPAQASVLPHEEAAAATAAGSANGLVQWLQAGLQSCLSGQ